MKFVLYKISLCMMPTCEKLNRRKIPRYDTTTSKSNVRYSVVVNIPALLDRSMLFSRLLLPRLFFPRLFRRNRSVFDEAQERIEISCFRSGLFAALFGLAPRNVGMHDVVQRVHALLGGWMDGWMDG